MKAKTINSLLLEIMLAIFFFALSATVILQIFVAARSQSARAALLNDALLRAQNMADEAYLADELKDMEIDCGEYTLRLSVTSEQTEGGTLRRAVVTATDDNGKLLVTLPADRYLPGEEVSK